MRSIIILLAFVFASCEMEAQRILASHEFEAENVRSVVIDGSFCDVSIRKDSRVFFKGVIEGSGDEVDYEITSDLQGEDLYIEVKRSSRRGERISRAELELTIPDGVRIDIDNSSGDVSITGLSADRFTIETSSGDIEISRINAELKLESTSGDISLRSVAGSVSSESTSGDQDFGDVNGDIEAVSTSGDMDIRGFSGSLRAQATSGNIEIEDGSGTLSLKTTSGDIDGYSIELTGDADLRASSGDINITFRNAMEDLSFDLRASSGDLRVGGRSGDKSLYIREGDIWVRGVTSSGDMRLGN